ncbi:MAG: hypothetical protein AB8B66_00405 [Rickettsiaceae bacterium]
MKYFTFVLTIMLFGCYPVETHTNYSHDFAIAKSKSNPIHLSFRNNTALSFYFLLSRNSQKEGYKIAVRYNSNAKNGLRLSSANDITLKFLVNKSQILTFKSSVKPRVISYNINAANKEIECIFAVSAADLDTLAYAHHVDAEISSVQFITQGSFNRIHTFAAFKDFIKNSP